MSNAETPEAEVNMSAVAAEIEAAKSEPTPEPTGADLFDQAVNYESEIDVPLSDFWDVTNQPDKPANTHSAEESVENVPEPRAVEEQIIKFKANGEERELTLEEAKKQLAMAEGGAKAFTKLAQANKKIKEFESKEADYRKKVELLDKLESIKHDENELIKVITGKDPDEWITDVLRKRRIMETGTETEKAQLEREQRVSALERQLEAQRERQEAAERAEQERNFNSEQTNLKSMLETEFFKNQIKLENELDSNDANEMLWTDGNRRMKAYVKKYKDHPRFKELLPKMAQKAFEDVAGKINRLATGSVQTKVDEAIKAKKQKAAEMAGVASTRKLSDVNLDEFSKLSVREVANKLVGKKNRFSLF